MQTGRKILNLRCDRKVSQQDLARACEMTPSALSKIEAGINSPRAALIWRIAQQLGVTVEYLLDERIPYPYQGYTWRKELLESEKDPSTAARMQVTLEEKAFLEALRESNQVVREVAHALPTLPVEALRLVHFFVHHVHITKPTADFAREFENLIMSGSPEEPPPPPGRKRTSKKKRAARRTPRRSSSRPRSTRRTRRS